MAATRKPFSDGDEATNTEGAPLTEPDAHDISGLVEDQAAVTTSIPIVYPLNHTPDQSPQDAANHDQDQQQQQTLAAGEDA